MEHGGKEQLYISNMAGFRPYDYLLKLVIVGNSSVGKSSLLLRFTDDEFHDNYLTTIGVDFRFKSLQVDKKVAKLYITGHYFCKKELPNLAPGACFLQKKMPNLATWGIFFQKSSQNCQNLSI